MIWKTRITEMTGSKYPIIMGAFAGFGTAQFAAAFSNTGGFGIITAANYRTPKKFREALRLAKEITDKPYSKGTSQNPK